MNQGGPGVTLGAGPCPGPGRAVPASPSPLPKQGGAATSPGLGGYWEESPWGTGLGRVQAGLQSPLYSLRPSGPSSLAPRALALRQRLKACLSAIHGFHEARLDDECAFYTSRAPPSGTSRVCTNPVATVLEWQDALVSHWPHSSLQGEVGWDREPASAA